MLDAINLRKCPFTQEAFDFIGPTDHLTVFEQTHSLEIVLSTISFTSNEAPRQSCSQIASVVVVSVVSCLFRGAQSLDARLARSNRSSDAVSLLLLTTLVLPAPSLQSWSKFIIRF